MTASAAQRGIDAITDALSANTGELELAAADYWCRPSDGNSDVLLVGRGETAECVGCRYVADGRGTYVGLKASDVSAHVRKHRTAGDRVPHGTESLIAYRWGRGT